VLSWAIEDLSGLGALAIHVDDEVRVFGEERLLPLGVTAIRAIRVGVYEFADREAVGLFWWRNFTHPLRARA
jgi:hypothetical protein